MKLMSTDSSMLTTICYFSPDFKPVTNVDGDQNKVEAVPHFFPDKNTQCYLVSEGLLIEFGYFL